MKPFYKAILLLTVCLIVLQFFQAELVFHRDKIELGQWYRLITGNFVHSNYYHLALNLASLWIAGFLFSDSLKIKMLILNIFILSVCVGVGLYLFNPDLLKYYGFSGVLYGLYLVGATTILLQKDYITGSLIYIFVTGKMLWGFFMGEDAGTIELIGMAVAVHAHLYGVLGSLLISLSLFFMNNTNRKHTPPV